MDCPVLSMDEMIASLRWFYPNRGDDEIRAEIERVIDELRDAPFWWSESELVQVSEAIAHE